MCVKSVKARHSWTLALRPSERILIMMCLSVGRYWRDASQVKIMFCYMNRETVSSDIGFRLGRWTSPYIWRRLL